MIMATKNSKSEKLNRLLESVEDSFDALSDEEIIQNAVEEGIDIDKCVNTMQEIVNNEIAQSRKNLLHEIRQAYEKHANPQKSETISNMGIPEMLEVLKQAIQGGQVTMAFRECEGMSEADLRNLLEDLDIIGAMDEKDD